VLSSRTNWSFTPNRLSNEISRCRQRGSTIIDLTESNPTRCGFTYDAEEILGALRDPRSLTYEPDPRGLREAREAVAAYYRERGAKVDPEQVFLTASTSEAYSYVLRLLADPGDSVLVPQPSYPLLDFLARLDDVELLPYPLIYERGWRMDLKALTSSLAAASSESSRARGSARAIIAVHPNNPTGSFVRQKEFEFLIGSCKEAPAALIADEVFSDYAFDPSVPREAGRETEGRVPSFASTTEVLTFTLSGLSKISALPQMKLAWVVVSGPPDHLQRALERLEVIADTYLSVSAPLGIALPRLLATRKTLQPQIMDRIRRNLRWLDQRLGEGLPLGRLETEGGWYVILHDAGNAWRSDEEWALELLRQDDVLVHPGHFYDFPCEGHLVLSLLPKPEVFEQGVSRIIARTSQRS